MVAALYDIHGNLPALDAVLQEIDQLPVDQIIIGGDVVLGPMSRECLDRLLDLPIPLHFIQGNCEVAVLNQMAGKLKAKLPEHVLVNIRWTAAQLTETHLKLMIHWPKTFKLETDHLGGILFCHATPRNENEVFTRLTSDEKLIPLFENQDANLVICGHTHMQFDRMIGTTRVINAGSVGMPFGKPGAYWLLIDEKIELKCTSYDFERAAAEIKDTSYPQAQEFAEKNVINPPGEKAMLELFKQAEIG